MKSSHRRSALIVALTLLAHLFCSTQAYAWDPVREATGRTLKQHAKRAIERTGKSIEKFVNNPIEYALERPMRFFQETCAAPANVLRYNHQRQVKNWERLPRALIQDVQRFYRGVNLDNVRFAENVKTINARAVTMGNLIYFRGRIDFRSDHDLWLVLHELEHTVQYRGETRSAKLCEYTLKAFARGLNHDDIDWERAADRKANYVMDQLYQMWRSEDELRPNQFYLENNYRHPVVFTVETRRRVYEHRMLPGTYDIISSDDPDDTFYRVYLPFDDGEDGYNIHAGRYYRFKASRARSVEIVEF